MLIQERLSVRMVVSRSGEEVPSAMKSSFIDATERQLKQDRDLS